MSNANMWTGRGIWLKGNTHTHTINSDGFCTTQEIAVEYGRRGYDFVFLTDHDKRTVPAEQIQKPLLIPAEEVSFRNFHFACLGLKKAWPPHAFRSFGQLLARARQEGAIVIQAHPYWCGIPSNACVQGGLTCPGLEIYNTVCDQMIGKGYSTVHWDDLLDAGHRILGFAVDDAHHSANIGGGWIMVKARAKTPPAILEAIRKGYFYASQGPEIKSISVRGREIKVSCSRVMRINFITNKWDGNCIFTGFDKLTDAIWTVPPNKSYVRIELINASGKIAWSNPIFFPR